jgi:uncharacterized protein (TIGR03437 family)
MKPKNLWPALVLASACAAFAQPVLRDARSAAGNLNPGLPGYGIARGSLMSIAGTTSSDAQTAAFPLTPSLNGVSVKIAIDGQEVDALPVSISATRILALVPSQAPTGKGKVRVTDANGTAEVDVTIVERNFGIFAQRGLGTNAGAAYALNLNDAGNTSNSLTQPAIPGQQIAILGSGAGATDQDETNALAQQDLSGDFKLYIGGQLANVLSTGRSGLGVDALGLPAGLSGVDWIKAEVPAGISGCRVSVVAVTDGTLVSNFATISVSPDGATCSDPGYLTSDDINALPASGSYNIGSIAMTRFTLSIASPLGNIDLNTDSASAGFERIDVGDYRTSGGGSYVSIGSCVVTFSAPDGSNTDNAALPTLLDAGAAINLKGPKGTTTLKRSDAGDYASVTVSGSSSPLIPSQGVPFAEAGAFTADNGSGGADVQSFTANLNNPKPFTWSNAASVTAVQRSQGVKVTWTGGASDATVLIAGNSTSGKVSAAFTCSERASAGSFQVPAAVTLAMPASTGDNQGAFFVLSSTYSRFTAPGLDQGVFVSSGGSLKTLSYK